MQNNEIAIRPFRKIRKDDKHSKEVCFITPELHRYLFKFTFKYYKPNDTPVP